MCLPRGDRNDPTDDTDPDMMYSKQKCSEDGTAISVRILVWHARTVQQRIYVILVIVVIYTFKCIF
jgi:hypothetical protein